jgi:hypothetical protein
MIATSTTSQNWKENTPCDNYQILVMMITLELVLGGTTIGFHIISSYQLNSSLESLWMEWKGVFSNLSLFQAHNSLHQFATHFSSI